MIRRIFLILLALCMLFSAVLCFADDLDDDDDLDDGDGLESLDDSGYEEEEQKDDFKSVSTYNMKTISADNFVYKLNDDGTGAILTSYTGEDGDVVFPDEINGVPVIAIDDGMCTDNPVIVKISIPGSVKTIGNAAFSRCLNLKTVIIDEGLIQLGMCCFGGCPELIDIQLPDSLEIVDNFVFAQCKALEEVKFGTQLKSIGMRAFYGCESLSSITVPGGDGVAFGEQLFAECPNEVEILY